jgi:TetR/AcrR family transcriptional regulator, transcriptional repressor for nem operon
MARPREFDESTVLDAVIQCFWSKGYEATSIKDLVDNTGITAASLYNAFGDKRALFRIALDHYAEHSVGERIQRCERLPPREAIEAFFRDILNRSLSDPQHKGCLLVNSALEMAPHDPEFQEAITVVLRRIEDFFLRCVKTGQASGSITCEQPARRLAQHLLAVLMGVRVLARVRPEKELLYGVVEPALAQLKLTRTVTSSKSRSS